jgi:Mn2+/Fe2+ NRAMP family transporter
MPDAAPQPEPFQPPHPGAAEMPRWQAGPLVDAPVFTWRNWFGLLGPGLLMGGSAIGGGEWLAGPAVTAKYGGGLMWLATISIVCQVIYNLEISRYTLYSGEPIFTGKFRTLPGPRFWLFVYLLLDFGAVFPYLASNAATPLAAVLLGRIPDRPDDQILIRGLGYAVFLLGMVPLIFGGKIYSTLKGVMTFKIVVVLGFLSFLAIFHSQPGTWGEILSGFVRFGTVPVERGEDENDNGRLDAGEDWDSDGRLDGIEPLLAPTIDTNADGKPDQWSDVDGDGKPDKFEDRDGDGHRDGFNVENVFVNLSKGRPLPTLDLSMIAMLSAFAAIAGAGGLSNTPISNYTRDQGWGMGRHVGAIPSVVGAHHLQLSHVGMVFKVDQESLPRWRRWYKHIARDQLALWMPACFLGMALPSMLSVQFLERGTLAGDWAAAGMTANGVQDHVNAAWGMPWGGVFWYLTLFCGFLTLGTSVSTQADGVIRRWVDVMWTSSTRLRKWEPRQIRVLYFSVLIGFISLAMTMLSFNAPVTLLKISANLNNLALGFSCFHTLAVNLVLLPKPLRPNWFLRIGLFVGGIFFTGLAVLTAIAWYHGVGW